MPILEKVLSLGGAITLAQFPQLFQQYIHELSGRHAELLYQVSLLENSAKLSHKPLSELIAKFLTNSDPDIKRQGQLMQQLIDRLESFTTALQSLQNASVWNKPYQFLHYLDRGVLSDTLSNFNAGISLNLETGIYLLIGFFLGSFVYTIARQAKRGVGHEPTPSVKT